MKRLATVMVLGIALLAIGKSSPLGADWRQVVADEGGDSGDNGSNDDGGDSGT
jgi:hypothetical protein